MQRRKAKGPGVTEPPLRPYRPRLIWAGVSLLVVALLVGAAAMILLSIPLAVAAVVLAAAGTVAILRGRVFRDTHGGSPMDRELRELRRPDEEQPLGRDPDDLGTVPTDSAAAEPHERPPSPAGSEPARLAGVGMLVLAGWLLLASALLSYPTGSEPGNEARWRDLTAAILLTLVGLVAARSDRPRPAVGLLCSLVGAGLAVWSVLGEAPGDAVRSSEVVSGALAVVLGLVVAATGVRRLARHP